MHQAGKLPVCNNSKKPREETYFIHVYNMLIYIYNDLLSNETCHIKTIWVVVPVIIYHINNMVNNDWEAIHTP